MIFTVLGSGTLVPDQDRGPAGFLVQLGRHAWLVDGGSGTLQRCARAGVDPRAAVGGIYSHRHPDHCADLVPLLFAMRMGPPPRMTPYPIWAGNGFARYLRQLQEIYGRWIAPEGGVPVHELRLDGADRADLGEGLCLRTAPAAHSGGALHLRFECSAASVVFSGDTGPSDALVELARGADLLVCECAGSDREPLEGHMHPSAIADLVAHARPREVWLTHLSPHVDPEAALLTVRRAGRPVRHAADLDRWDSPPPSG